MLRESLLLMLLTVLGLGLLGLHLLGVLGGDDHVHHPASHLVQLQHYLLASQGEAGVAGLRGAHWKYKQSFSNNHPAPTYPIL